MSVIMSAVPPHHPPLSCLLPAALARGRRIGLLGGSFNPPHAGHRHIALQALKRLRLHEVWWLPTLRNPLKPADVYADFAARLQQARLVARHARMRVLDIEWRLGTAYTVELLDILSPVLRQGHFVWLMGADSFATFHRWRDWRRIARTLPLAVFDRPGATMAALTSPAARVLRHHRLPARAAGLLAGMAAPAWVFLPIPRHALSSTALRAQGAPFVRQAKNLASKAAAGA